MRSFSASGGRENSRCSRELPIGARGLACDRALVGQGFGVRALLFLGFLLVILLPLPGGANSVTLAWDRSDSDIAGYRLYYGLAPRTYPFVVDVGPATACSVSNLVSGTTYFFAVTAYNHGGVESDFSSEIIYTPGLRVASISANDRGATLAWQSEPGAVYRVLATQTLTDSVWLDVSGPISGVGAITTWMHVRTTSDAAMFYGIEALSGIR